MELKIEHRTRTDYPKPQSYSIQQLRLTPTSGFGQRVKCWEIRVNGGMSPYRDAFGNNVHTLVVDTLHEFISITAVGEIETGLDLPPPKDVLPLPIYLRATPLTLLDESLVGFVKGFKPRLIKEVGLMELTAALHDQVKWDVAHSHHHRTAAEIFAAGKANSEEMVHLFLACSRKMGTPARFVSGYRYNPALMQLENHAWADVWLEGAGWSSLDVAHQEKTSELHVRLATGLDARDACQIHSARQENSDIHSSFQVQALEMAQSQQ